MEYSKKVMQYFMHPKNMGTIKNASGIGKVGNVICGDIMWLFIKVIKKNNKEVISDAKFKTIGCAAAIASSSMLTELVKGKTIKEALKLTKEDVLKSLGGLPPTKVHCSLLAIDALREAIYDYLKKRKRKIPKFLEREHKRIEKEMKIAEKRYREFVKMQEKLNF